MYNSNNFCHVEFWSYPIGIMYIKRIYNLYDIYTLCKYKHITYFYFFPYDFCNNYYNNKYYDYSINSYVIENVMFNI